LQNLLMKGAKPGAWFDIDIPGEQSPDPLIRVQRIGLSAAPVQGEHEQFPQPLAQRMFVDQIHQLGDHVLTTAQLQVEGDPFLECSQPELIQPVAFLIDELPVHPCERIAPPQRQRRMQEGRRPGSIPGRAGGPGLAHSRFEDCQIQRRRSDRQSVAAAGGLDHRLRTPRVIQRTTQPRDVSAERHPRTHRWVHAPHSVDQILSRCQSAPAQQQQGQHPALLRRSQAEVGSASARA
jgi:hypothetical protein